MYSLRQWFTLLGAVIVTVYATIEPVEVDLVFPRNDTYQPTIDFPIVFAVQNSQRAELLNLYIRYQVRWGDLVNNYTSGFHDLYWANYSSADPYFAFNHFGLDRPEHWYLTWELRWASCDDKALANPDGEGGFSRTRWQSGWRYFTTDDSAPQEVDLTAATADATCPNDINAVIINVTDTTRNLPASADPRERDICIGTLNSTDSATATTPDPCRVMVDERTAASIAAHRHEYRCDWDVSAPEDCPAENGASQQALQAVSFSLAVLGVLGFALS